jgi:hypothetical protein
MLALVFAFAAGCIVPVPVHVQAIRSTNGQRATASVVAASSNEIHSSGAISFYGVDWEFAKSNRRMGIEPTVTYCS